MPYKIVIYFFKFIFSTVSQHAINRQKPLAYMWSFKPDHVAISARNGFVVLDLKDEKVTFWV
jgi:hypothetical protein